MQRVKRQSQKNRSIQVVPPRRSAMGLIQGVMQEERIDDPDRIERYLRLFDKDDVKKLETGVKTVIEKDEWQLLP